MRDRPGYNSSQDDHQSLVAAGAANHFLKASALLACHAGLPWRRIATTSTFSSDMLGSATKALPLHAFGAEVAGRRCQSLDP
jgi:hypothetical protein